ncbi:hypothetical protein HKL94_01970 [Candidatus Parcubacteria bacterium]|nr:hypothetical protein [Candidatus Parcubacteria bacterium]
MVKWSGQRSMTATNTSRLPIPAAAVAFATALHEVGERTAPRQLMNGVHLDLVTKTTVALAVDNP